MVANRIIADSILVVHTALVAFNILGLLLILVGLRLRWHWVRNFWFRIAHLLAIVVVVSQAWGGVICPLTKWENHFRQKASQVTYSGSFVAYWIHRMIFFEAEAWVFAVCYTVFGGLVVLTFIFGRPRWPTCIVRR